MPTSIPVAFGLCMPRSWAAAGEARVNGFLFRGDQEAGTFTVTGSADDFATWAQRIWDEGEALIRRADPR